MNAWLLAGWTMLHFVWVGALVAAAGAIARLAVRRCGPNVRYATSLAMLAAVACTPVVIAGVLASNPALMPREAPAVVAALQPPALPGGSGNEVRGTVIGGDAIGDATPGQSPGLMPETIVELKGLDAELKPPALPGGSGDTLRDTTAGGNAVSDATPGQSPGLKVDVMRRVVGALPWVWLIGAPVTFLLLAAGLVGSRRLTRAGTPLVDGRAAEACARLRSVLGVTQRVALAAVEGLAQPVLVGIVKPTILLPAAALNGWTIEELEMVLVHELAHVRRWDNLVNLAQRVIEAALFFHPCVWLASRQLRRDREECCDAIVVQHTQAPEAYAELLINVASNLRSEPGRPRPGLLKRTKLAASCTLAEHALAGRLRRILKLEDEPMWVSRRMMGMLVVLMCVSTMAVYRAFSAPAPVLNAAAVEAEEERAKPQAAESEAALSSNYPTVSYTVNYMLHDIETIDPKAWLRLTGSEEVIVRWHEDNQSTAISAPRAVHEQISNLLSGTRDAEDRARTKEMPQQLRAQIDMCRTQLMNVERELADAEVMKQVAIQQSQSPAALEAAVAEELSQDRELENYEQQWRTVSQQITLLREKGLDPDAKLIEQSQQTRNALRAHQASAVTKIRERLAKIPNEALRAAMIEYGVRVEYLKKKKAELEAKLKDVEALLEMMTPRDVAKPAPAALAPYRLAVGDKLYLHVEGTLADQPIDGIFTIWADGNLPLGSGYGFVSVRGLTVEEAQAAIMKTLAKVLTEPLVEPVVVVRKAGGASGGEPSGRWSHSVPFPEGMGDAESQWVVEALKRQGIGAEVTLSDGKLVLQIATPTPLPPFKTVWESHMVGDRVQRMCRFIGEDGRDFLRSPVGEAPLIQSDPYRPPAGTWVAPPVVWPAPWPVDAAQLTTQTAPPIHDLDLVAAEGVPRDAGELLVAKLKEQHFNAILSIEGERLAIRLNNVSTKLKPIWETRLVDGRPQMAVTFVNEADGVMTATIDAGDWQPERPPMIVPMPGDRYGAPVVAPVLSAPTEGTSPSARMEQPAPRRPGATSFFPEIFIVNEVNPTETRGHRAPTDFARLAGIAMLEDAKVDPAAPAGSIIFSAAGADQLTVTAPRRFHKVFAEYLAAKTPLYDGRTFDEWRGEWRTELKVDKRMESIEALAAFARAGYGREAAEALLDVAGEYDFSSMDTHPDGNLKGLLVGMLTSQGASRVEPAVWLPLLMERLAREPARWQPLSSRLLGKFQRGNPLDAESRQLVLTMATDERYGPNAAPLQALHRSGPGNDPDVERLIRAALGGPDRKNALTVFRNMGPFDLSKWPEKASLLLDPDDAVSREARTLLALASQGVNHSGPQVEAVLAAMVKVLNDENRKSEHLAAVRVVNVLHRFIKAESDRPPEQRAPTIAQLDRAFEQFQESTNLSLLVACAITAELVDGRQMTDTAAWTDFAEDVVPEKQRAAFIVAMKEGAQAEREGLVDTEMLEEYGGNRFR